MPSVTPQASAANAQLELVARLQNGDEDVLNDILQSFGGLVLRKLRRVFFALFNEADLEEILTEALYRVWEKREAYRGERGSLLNWFWHIARNLASDQLKRGWRQVQANQCPFSVEDLHLAVQRGPSGDEDEPRPLPPAQQDLLEILGDLSAKNRAIILAFAAAHGDGVWTAPLVEEFGMSPGALRTKAHRLLVKIRKEMQKRGYEVHDLGADGPC